MEDRMLYLCLQMLRMSTGHMEGDLQPLYLLLTDCYIYLLRKGNQQKKQTKKKTCALAFIFLLFLVRRFLTCWQMYCLSQTRLLWCSVSGAADKPYTVEDAVSYNELDYLSVSFTTVD